MADDLLTLLALDTEDLSILSAHLQDAVVRPEDVSWRKAEQRLVVVLRRFDWAAPEAQPRRRLAALHFNRVLRVSHQGVAKGRPACVLAVTFQETEAPSGAVLVSLAAGGVIRAEVECIEAQLRDLGPIWEAASRPVHRLEEPR